MPPSARKKKLEDEHVGVHRHADREHDAGDAPEREGPSEPVPAGEQVEDVEHHGDDRDRAGELVVDQHEDDDHYGADQPRADPFLVRVGAEGGSLFFFLDAATPGIYTLSLHDALPI